MMEEILHQLIGSLSPYLLGFVHPRWCRISSINSTKRCRKPCQRTTSGWNREKQLPRIEPWDLKDLQCRKFPGYFQTNISKTNICQSCCFSCLCCCCCCCCCSVVAVVVVVAAAVVVVVVVVVVLVVVVVVVVVGVVAVVVVVVVVAIAVAAAGVTVNFNYSLAITKKVSHIMR